MSNRPRGQKTDKKRLPKFLRPTLPRYEDYLTATGSCEKEKPDEKWIHPRLREARKEDEEEKKENRKNIGIPIYSKKYDNTRYCINLGIVTDVRHKIMTIYLFHPYELKISTYNIRWRSTQKCVIPQIGDVVTCSDVGRDMGFQRGLVSMLPPDVRMQREYALICLSLPRCFPDSIKDLICDFLPDDFFDTSKKDPIWYPFWKDLLSKLSLQNAKKEKKAKYDKKARKKAKEKKKRKGLASAKFVM